MSSPSGSPFQYGFAPFAVSDKSALARRIIDAYRLAVSDFKGHGSSFWGAFEEHHRPVLLEIERSNVKELEKILKNPSKNDFFYGFDDLIKQFTDYRLQGQINQEDNARRIYNALLQVAIGVGAIPCPNFEAGQIVDQLDVETVLKYVDQQFGFVVDFPNPYSDEFGLATSRGIASDRAVQALYQSWRVSRIVEHLGSDRVVEIGAGLGRNVYYARKFGISSYTIIDIPTTQIAQADYLGRVCGDDDISLLGEDEPASIRLRSPSWLMETSEKIDLVLNVDSLTEINRDVALGYVKFSKRSSRSFLSINHELHPTRVSDLLQTLDMKAITRAPYWPRSGYVEELVINDIPPPPDSHLTSNARDISRLQRWWRG